ncbi:MAG TPA: glycolate oxidase subunit GlcF [Candidatus Tenderia sp.]|nr:glycolate oxidase subunit GlcF [Candidatus Tenderia sp.]
MQTNLADDIKDTRIGDEADAILRSCVHCGFCTATCPTYQHNGDELDGPRGRIYLIKQMLEGRAVSDKTQHHLDRCLTCRSCETTCPSGVKYGRLVEIGREYIDKKITRPLSDRATRKVLLSVLPHPQRLAPLIKISQLLKPLLPAALKKKIPLTQTAQPASRNVHGRKMITLAGCAQSVIKPGANSAAIKILDHLGITLTTPPAAGCCGAVSYHLTQRDEGLAFMRQNIDAWWPLIDPAGEAPHEAILVTASGCGAMVKEYGEALKDDPRYAQKAAWVSTLAKDPCEVVANENISSLRLDIPDAKIAFQTPCTLQHAQQLNGRVETILETLGFKLVNVADGHLCCGSAGTYSILQPSMSQALLDQKLTALMHHQPDIIATANIGCHMQLESQATIPVKHWLELVADAMVSPADNRLAR